MNENEERENSITISNEDYQKIMEELEALDKLVISTTNQVIPMFDSINNKLKELSEEKGKRR